MTVRKRLPRGLRRGHDDSIACKHRDLSCCEACLKAHAPELVDVMGRAYWIPDPDERAELTALRNEEPALVQEMREEARYEESEFDAEGRL